MRRNHEDRLIELAFEELTAHEAGQLHDDLSKDPSQAAKLRAYAEMRDGLASLRDVPEMQMSCDRLRDAILAGGLKEPRAAGWTWFAIPVAVAAGAFLFTIVSRRPSMQVPIVPVASVSNPGSSFDVAMERSPNVGLESIRPESATTPLGTLEFKMASEPEVTPKARKKVIPTSVARTSHPVADNTPKVAFAAAPGVGEAAKMSLTAETPTAPTKEKDDRITTASVIVITPEQNGDTGTQRATEVESVSNVVIGG